MRPFVCTRCDVGWLAPDAGSICEHCGRPGFTTYLDTNREYRNVDPLTWDMLLGAARRKEQESVGNPQDRGR